MHTRNALYFQTIYFFSSRIPPLSHKITPEFQCFKSMHGMAAPSFPKRLIFFLTRNSFPAEQVQSLFSLPLLAFSFPTTWQTRQAQKIQIVPACTSFGKMAVLATPSKGLSIFQNRPHPSFSKAFSRTAIALFLLILFSVSIDWIRNLNCHDGEHLVAQLLNPEPHSAEVDHKPALNFQQDIIQSMLLVFLNKETLLGFGH